MSARNCSTIAGGVPAGANTPDQDEPSTPVTPDSVPVLGATRVPNFYVNTGHGTLGWTMACGSGRVLADLIGGVKPEIETADLALSRY